MYRQAAQLVDDSPSRWPAQSGNIVSVPNGSPLLEATGLRKSYGTRLVLDGISLAVNGGEVVGLLLR